MLSQDVELLNYSHALPGRVYGRREKAAARVRVSTAGLQRGIVSLAGALVAMLCMFYVVNGFVAQQGYEMQVLRSEIIAMEKANEAARLEVARLESPARIQAIAESELGMHVPQYAIYGSSDTVVDQSGIRD